ncbi:MAG: pilus assembly protein PilM [Oscillospiraceae bacterium]
MTTSVCIHNNEIKVLCGSLSRSCLAVEEWHSVSLPDDAVINGVVISDAPVRAAISELRGKLGNAFDKVNLVLNSNSTLVKRANVPLLPERKLIKLVENEFSDMEDSRDELMYDYMVLSPHNSQGGGSILCTAVEKAFVASYISLFSELGVKIAAIDIALASLVRLASTSRIAGKTCIMSVLDADAVNSALFVDGAFRFNGHARLFQERGTVESSLEISQHISSIIQFNASEKTGREITHIYLGGLYKNEQRITIQDDDLTSSSLADYIKSALDVEVLEFPPCDEIRLSNKTKRRAFPLGEYVYCAGNLLRR